MRKLFITLILVLGVVTLVGAQEVNSGEFDNGATCQKYKFSLNFGRGFSDPNLFNLNNSYSSNVQPVVPAVYGVNQNYNPSTNMIGVEFRWMFKPNWSLNLTGLGILKANPEQDDVMGIPNPQGGNVWLEPNINNVPFQAAFDWNVEIGVSHYFDLPNKKLLPYLGLSFLYAHGSNRWESTYFDVTSSSLNPLFIRGMKRAEFLSWGFAVPVGFEYYVSEGLFIGASINAINYFYSLTQLAPGEGMELARADQSTFSFFTRPMLKLGIAF